MAKNRQIDITKDAAKARRLLKEHAPKALNALDKANREAAVPIINYAKSITPSGDLPLSGWAGGTGRLKWRTADVQKGFKFRAGKKSSFSDYRALLQFRSLDPAGSIFEIAGRKSDGTTPQGKAMIKNLNERYPRTSRLLWQAHDEKGETELIKAITDNYGKAVDELNSNLRRLI
jgi:hypothetical protein